MKKKKINKSKSKRAKPIRIKSSSVNRKVQSKKKFVWTPTVFREDYPNTPKGTARYTRDRKKAYMKEYNKTRVEETRKWQQKNREKCRKASTKWKQGNGKEWCKKYAEDNREHINMMSRERYAKMENWIKRKDKYYKYKTKKGTRIGYFEHKFRELLQHAKKREKEGTPCPVGFENAKQFAFHIIEEVIPEFGFKCFYTGDKLKLTKDGSSHPLRPSINRHDHSLGYVRGNIVLTSWEVNRLLGKLDSNLAKQYNKGTNRLTKFRRKNKIRLKRK